MRNYIFTSVDPTLTDVSPHLLQIKHAKQSNMMKDMARGKNRDKKRAGLFWGRHREDHRRIMISARATKTWIHSRFRGKLTVLWVRKLQLGTFYVKVWSRNTTSFLWNHPCKSIFNFTRAVPSNRATVINCNVNCILVPNTLVWKG